MNSLDFESANKLPWTNDYIDFAIGITLLLRTYHKKEDAEPFHLNKRNLEIQCLESSPNIPELSSVLRKVFPFSIVDDQVKKLVSAIELDPQWLDQVLAIINLKDEKLRVKKERVRLQEKQKRMTKAFIDGLYPEEDYNRERKQIELDLESLVISGADAAEEAGKLLVNLSELWESANPEEQRRLLLTMLDAVYVDAKTTNSIVAVKPKPPFHLVFQVVAQRGKSVIHILNGPTNQSVSQSLFLVETGESRTPRPKETAQDLLQA